VDLSDLLSPRTAEDIFAQRVRLTIGDREVLLPALVIADTEDWLRSFDETMAPVLGAVTAAGDDPGEALNALARDIEPFLALLISYDREGLLPSRDELRRSLTPMDLLVCCLEVWRAANPLLDVALGVVVGTRLATTAREIATATSPEPTSSPPRRGAGRPAPSAAN
jgi:hypothetical protein